MSKRNYIIYAGILLLLAFSGAIWSMYIQFSNWDVIMSHKDWFMLEWKAYLMIAIGFIGLQFVKKPKQ